MRYFSTNHKSKHVSFREAVLKGQPEDGGLYFPEQIPKFNFWKDFHEKTKEELAFRIIKPYVGDQIDEDSLFQICAETVNFDFPLVKLSDSISVLELFHGNTLAFKDVGARFMSRCLRYFSKKLNKKIVVIVATSGDTGGAVADGFWQVENTVVFILYPKGKVSQIQELQIASLGGNIKAIEVNGNFDDCQRLVKTLLNDDELRRRFYLTSANSINIARLLPQQFYYVFAYQQWQETSAPVISVPSGNFGNLCALVFAHFSGLPCEKIIAACNANDTIPRFLKTGKMQIKPAIETLSTAMDIALPSNFVRIMEIFKNDLKKLKTKLHAVSISDEETVQAIKRVYQTFSYILDPHGAVGFAALEKYLEQSHSKGFFLETAHPAKFDVVVKILGNDVLKIPEKLKNLLSRHKESIEIDVDHLKVKDLILSFCA
ncbi:MAG: threonine synthase [Pyrinomonadaceae bacterium]|nr:threonine synthase [Pyrinomonadaceae bacterium]MCX7640008.1 threonine synthase [Pyrinomonadaceae bacterium]MDW8304180.1 threonine synthase [Acidobacteriota bacterium]